MQRKQEVKEHSRSPFEGSVKNGGNRVLAANLLCERDYNSRPSSQVPPQWRARR